MKSYDKRDVALELLDAAVSEHLDHSRHFAAYNLAAVAEELLFERRSCSGNATAYTGVFAGTYAAGYAVIYEHPCH